MSAYDGGEVLGGIFGDCAPAIDDGLTYSVEAADHHIGLGQGRECVIFTLSGDGRGVNVTLSRDGRAVNVTLSGAGRCVKVIHSSREMVNLVCK